MSKISIGLGATASPAENELIDTWTKMEKILLEQQVTQARVAGEGTKGAANFIASSYEKQAEATHDDAIASISSGSTSLGMAGAGEFRGYTLNGQIAEENTRINNIEEATKHLNEGKPGEPGLARDKQTQESSSFVKKFVNQEGFKFGDSIEGLDKELKSAPSEHAKEQALNAAKKASTKAQKNKSNLISQQDRFGQWYQTLGQGLASVAQGSAITFKSQAEADRAAIDAAKTSMDFLSQSANANSGQLNSSFENAKSHISSSIQTLDDALFQVDNMRA